MGNCFSKKIKDISEDWRGFGGDYFLISFTREDLFCKDLEEFFTEDEINLIFSKIKDNLPSESFGKPFQISFDLETDGSISLSLNIDAL